MTPPPPARARNVPLLGCLLTAVLGCGSATTHAATADGGTALLDVLTMDIVPVDVVRDTGSDAAADVASEPSADAAVMVDVPHDNAGTDAPCVLPDGRVPNLVTDNENCGGCGITCCAGSICFRGECMVDCQTGVSLCPIPDAGVLSDAGVAGCALSPWHCALVSIDPDNCGECGHRCGAGQRCSAGHCM